MYCVSSYSSFFVDPNLQEIRHSLHIKIYVDYNTPPEFFNHFLHSLHKKIGSVIKIIPFGIGS